MTEIIDGYIVDSETGEVLGLAHAESEFHVTDRTSAEWVLDKIGQNEAALTAIEQRRAAVNANLDRQADAVRRRAAWLDARFGGELRTWANEQLATSKRKSIQLDFGKIGFRTTKGSVKVQDAVAAVAWLKERWPCAVQMEPKILVSNIPDTLRGQLPANAFDYEPPAEKFFVTTGREK